MIEGLSDGVLLGAIDAMRLADGLVVGVFYDTYREMNDAINRMRARMIPDIDINARGDIVLRNGSRMRFFAESHAEVDVRGFHMDFAFVDSAVSEDVKRKIRMYETGCGFYRQFEYELEAVGVVASTMLDDDAEYDTSDFIGYITDIGVRGGGLS